MHPNTRLEVAPADGSELGTLIRQTLGKLFLDIETMPGRSFRVETPALMAGVTGTMFTVEVTQNESMLIVHEGTVWMARADREDERVYFGARPRVCVLPGRETALVTKSHCNQLTVSERMPGWNGGRPAGHQQDATL